MSNKILIVSILMLTLSGKTFHGSEISSISYDQTSINQKILSIKINHQSNQITSDAAIKQLYALGLNLTKGTPIIADIIDTLGDLGARNEGLRLLHMHGL